MSSSRFFGAMYASISSLFWCGGPTKFQMQLWSSQGFALDKESNLSWKTKTFKNDGNWAMNFLASSLWGCNWCPSVLVYGSVKNLRHGHFCITWPCSKPSTLLAAWQLIIAQEGWHKRNMHFWAKDGTLRGSSCIGIYPSSNGLIGKGRLVKGCLPKIIEKTEKTFPDAPFMYGLSNMKGEKWPHGQGEMARQIFPSHRASGQLQFFCVVKTRWWFIILFSSLHGGRFAFWLIVFNWVETTN